MNQISIFFPTLIQLTDWLYPTAAKLRAALRLNLLFHNHFIFLPHRSCECCTLLHMAAIIIVAVPLPSPGSNGGVMDERGAPAGVRVSTSVTVTALSRPLIFFPGCSCTNRKPRSSLLPLSLSHSVSLSVFLTTKWPGGVDVSGEALLLVPLDCNLATLKENASQSVFLSASSSLEINCYPGGSF